MATATMLCNFIEFSIQKSCHIKLKAIWRSQNYLPFTFSLEWIGMKRGLGNDGIKTLKASVAKKKKKKKQASHMIAGRLDSRFSHCMRGKVWVRQPQEMFTSPALPCSNGSHVDVFALHTRLFGSRWSGGYRKSITACELWTQRKQGFNERTRCTCELSVDLSALLTPSLSVKTMLRAPESPMESVDQPLPLTVEWQRDWKEKNKNWTSNM